MQKRGQSFPAANDKIERTEQSRAERRNATLTPVGPTVHGQITFSSPSRAEPSASRSERERGFGAGGRQNRTGPDRSTGGQAGRRQDETRQDAASLFGPLLTDPLDSTRLDSAHFRLALALALALAQVSAVAVALRRGRPRTGSTGSTVNGHFLFAVGIKCRPGGSEQPKLLQPATADRFPFVNTSPFYCVIVRAVFPKSYNSSPFHWQHRSNKKFRFRDRYLQALLLGRQYWHRCFR